METKATVLFVCVHNAGRSQMAAGYLKHLAGSEVKVISAGTDPGSEINPMAMAVMLEEGIDLLIKLQDILYAINLFTDTVRAHIGREKKVSRHIPFDNVQYVELPVKFNGSIKCGNFFLYGEKELNQIEKIIYQL
jgi:hypothetical protein